MSFDRDEALTIPMPNLRANVLAVFDQLERLQKLHDADVLLAHRNGQRAAFELAALEMLDQDSWPTCITRLQGKAFDLAVSEMKDIAENVRSLAPDAEPQTEVQPNVAAPPAELGPMSRALVERAFEILEDRDLTIGDACGRATTLLREALGR